METGWFGISGPTNADDISIHLALLEYVSEIMIGWNHPLLHHFSYAISATIV